MRTDTRVILSLVSAIAGLFGCERSFAQDLKPSTIPDALKAPTTEKLLLTVSAKGVQIYECRAKKDDATQFEWALKAPEADLFDASGKKIGRHYAGPSWESIDGSRVVGEVKARQDSPGTIPWLLLSAKKTEGTGVFSKVTSIQRIDTTGGKSPESGCDAAGSGKEVRVPYTATYLYYEAKE